MGRGSQKLMTVWIPLGDVPVEDGALMVCPGTHLNDQYGELHNTYGELDVDRDVPGDPKASGHLTDHPFTWEPKEGHTQCWDTELSSISMENRARWVTEDFQVATRQYYCSC